MFSEPRTGASSVDCRDFLGFLAYIRHGDNGTLEVFDNLCGVIDYSLRTNLAASMQLERAKPRRGFAGVDGSDIIVGQRLGLYASNSMA